MEGLLTCGKKKYHFVLREDGIVWGKKGGKGKKNDGECTFKRGSSVKKEGDGICFGPDSKGNMVSVTAGSGEELGKWFEAISEAVEAHKDDVENEEFSMKGWMTREKKKFFFTLSGGYLAWYQKEPSPSIPHNKNFVKEITLNSCVVEDQKGGFTLIKTTPQLEKKKGGKKVYVFLVDDEDKKRWIEELEIGIEMANHQKLGGALKRASMGARFKKKMAQSVATSKAGKGVAKKALNDEVTGLLAALKMTFEAFAGKERAEELENNMIKIITKLFFAVDTKAVAMQDLRPADKHLRVALRKISMVWGQRYRSALTRGQPPKEKAAVDEVVALLKEVEGVLIKTLSGVLQPKNIALIRATITFFRDPKYLTFVASQDDLDDVRSMLETAMDAYCSVELDFDSF